MRKTSLAAVAVEASKMELRELPIPEIGRDDGLVRVEACGITGSEYEWFRGEGEVPFPLVLGHEVVGLVEAIGERASACWGVREGDRVVIRTAYECGECAECKAGERCPSRGWFGFTSLDKAPGLWGGFSEYIYLPPVKARVAVPIHKSVPATTGVMFNALGSGWHWGVEVPRLEAGQSICIMSPGQRGLCALLAAREAGASQIFVTGLGRDAHKLALAREFGADATIDVDAQDPVEVVRELTRGKGVDVVLDCTPSDEAVVHAVKMVRPAGTVVLGGLKGYRPLKGLSADDIIWKRITLRGALGSGLTGFNRAIEALNDGRYPQLGRLHTHAFPIEETVRALDVLAGETAERAIAVAVVPKPRG